MAPAFPHILQTHHGRSHSQLTGALNRGFKGAASAHSLAKRQLPACQMIVIQTKEFHRLYCKHVEAGSLHGKMAQRAATVITNLTHGLPPGVATTNNGENRLRNCVK